jgi:exodeoxyribonuclease VIII
MPALMIDIETLGTSPDALILTIAAQSFNPVSTGYINPSFYARIDIDSQPGRSMDQGTIDWWAKQPAAAQAEAFNSENRMSLTQALNELTKLIWSSSHIWANGPTFDMAILENAYKSSGMSLPWQYYNVRDARTVYSLWPDLPKPTTSHHALEDCKRQIDLLQQTLHHFNITNIK